MLLRSSSTPILGSLHPSHLESPKPSSHHPELLNSPRHRPSRFSMNQTVPLNAVTPSSPSPKATFSCKSHDQLRRTHSEGNLDEMINTMWKGFNESSPKKLHGDQEVGKERGLHVKCHNRQQRSMQEGTEDIAKTLAPIKVKSQNMVVERDVELTPSKMHLAKGLGTTVGVCTIGGVGGGTDECQRLGLGGDSSGQATVEEYYKRMVEENPGDSLYLRNYAQFLYQTKKDLKRAEEFFARAILADPTDGDVLSQYAKVTWELHRDEERASCYFQQAVQVAPENSHVLAAYAGFLWETEEDEATPAPAFNNLVAVKA